MDIIESSKFILLRWIFSFLSKISLGIASEGLIINQGRHKNKKLNDFQEESKIRIYSILKTNHQVSWSLTTFINWFCFYNISSSQELPRLTSVKVKSKTLKSSNSLSTAYLRVLLTHYLVTHMVGYMVAGQSQTQCVQQTLMPVVHQYIHLALNKHKQLNMNVLIEIASNKTYWTYSYRSKIKFPLSITVFLN